MKAKHHFWSSLAAGGALYWATGSAAAFGGAMLGGFAIDADHVLDQLWSIRKGAEAVPRESGGRRVQSLYARYFRRRKLVRLPLIFHSYELLAVIAAVTLSHPTPFLVGLFSGYVLHLTLDIIRHYHEFRSPLFYLLAYRLSRGFRRDLLVKAEYL
ncbi:MAG: hypothetical protein AABO41_21540 [Acidobacteriota bacterium]